MIGVYSITNPIGQIYIGQSVNLKKRFQSHKSLKDKQIKRLYNSFITYGVSAHIFKIELICKKEELDINERYYQELHESIGEKGLNSYLTGTNDKKKQLSLEMRKNISISATSRKKSIYSIEKTAKQKRIKILDKDSKLFFESIKDASAYLNISRSHLSKMLSGKRTNKTNCIYAK
jgi:hypothetical protein